MNLGSVRVPGFRNEVFRCFHLVLPTGFMEYVLFLLLFTFRICKTESNECFCWISRFLFGGCLKSFQDYLDFPRMGVRKFAYSVFFFVGGGWGLWSGALRVSEPFRPFADFWF